MGRKGGRRTLRERSGQVLSVNARAHHKRQRRSKRERREEVKCNVKVNVVTGMKEGEKEAKQTGGDNKNKYMKDKESNVEAKRENGGGGGGGGDAKRQKTSIPYAAASAPQGKEEALRRLRSLHIQMRDLEQEMKVFENAVLPVDSVKEELSVNDFYQECVNRISLELAQQYDLLRNEFSKGFTQHGQSMEGHWYQLQSTISAVQSKHARYMTYLCCILGNTPQWISADKYCMIYDTIEADYPFVHEHIGIFANASNYLSINQ